MKFFVPHATDDEEAGQVWQAVRAFLAAQGLPTGSRRIWKLDYRHNCEAYSLEVGKPHRDLGEDVLIMLRACDRPLYYVCTPNRGVLRDEPYLVGVDLDTRVVDFEPAPKATAATAPAA